MDEEVRQSILLKYKEYVEEHWTPFFQPYTCIAHSFEDSQIKELADSWVVGSLNYHGIMLESVTDPGARRFRALQYSVLLTSS